MVEGIKLVNFNGRPAPLLGYMVSRKIPKTNCCETGYKDIADAAFDFASKNGSCAAVVAHSKDLSERVVFTGIRINPEVKDGFNGLCGYLEQIAGKLKIDDLTSTYRKVRNPQAIFGYEVHFEDAPKDKDWSSGSQKLDKYLETILRLNRYAQAQITYGADRFSFIGVSWTTSEKSSVYPKGSIFVEKALRRWGLNNCEIEHVSNLPTETSGSPLLIAT